MKKKLLISGITILCLVAAVIAQNRVSFRIKGSDTVLPLSQMEVENFTKTNKNYSISVTGGGSGIGLSALMDGTTDIAMSSRKMKLTEKMKLQDAGKAVKETIIAYDALAVIVNPANKITQLTREQVEGIYTGKIKNWKDVGGADEKIVAYARETSSGTYEFFKEHLLASKNYAPTVLNMPATGAIVQSVSQTKGAIGYVGLAYLDKDVKPVKVSMDKGKTFVAPSMASAKNKTYPVIRPLFYYYLTRDEAKLKPLISYILSETGQNIVEKVGYVPLN